MRFYKRKDSPYWYVEVSRGISRSLKTKSLTRAKEMAGETVIDYKPKDFEGYVYCATNMLFPYLSKIGMTAAEPSERISSLSNSSLPEPYDLRWSIGVTKPYKTERWIHNALSFFHYKKEFFKIDADEALKYLVICGVRKTPLPKVDDVQKGVNIIKMRQSIMKSV